MLFCTVAGKDRPLLIKQVSDDAFTLKLKPSISSIKSRPPGVDATSFCQGCKLNQHLSSGRIMWRFFSLPEMWPQRSSWRFETASRLTTLGVPHAVWRLHNCGSETR